MLMRHLILLIGLVSMGLLGMAQPTFPDNGVADPRDPCYALTHAYIIKDAQTTLSDATLVVRNGKIVAVGANVTIPKDAIIIDCHGKFIYPSFIDLYADYGVETPKRPSGGGGFFSGQINSNQKGAYGWNQALHPEVDAVKLFVVDEAKAKAFRDAGFGTVLTHQRDGIARGTGTLVGCPHINPASLREKGFTDDILVKHEAAMAGAFEIQFVFNRWTLGEEFLRDTLEKLSTDKVTIRVIRAGVGAITRANEAISFRICIQFNALL